MGLQAAWAILPVAFAGYLVGGVGHGVKNVLLRTLHRRPRARGASTAARSPPTTPRATPPSSARWAPAACSSSALGPRAALLVAGLGPILAALAGLAALRRDERRRRAAAGRERLRLTATG